MNGLSLHARALALIVLLALAPACSNNPSGTNTNSSGKSEPPSYEGFHDITNCNAILAWAWDMNRPNESVKVDIYDGNVLIATVAADQFRQDLADAGKGNGKHGVFFPVPPQLKDGKIHYIQIKFAATSIDLVNGPKELKCNFDE